MYSRQNVMLASLDINRFPVYVQAIDRVFVVVTMSLWSSRNNNNDNVFDLTGDPDSAVRADPHPHTRGN